MMKKFKHILKEQTDATRFQIRIVNDCIRKLESIGLIGIQSGSRQDSARYLAMRRYYERLSDIKDITENLTKIAICGQNEMSGYLQDLKDYSQEELRPVQLQNTQKVIFELKVKISISYPNFFLNDIICHDNSLIAYTVYKVDNIGKRTLLVGKEETINYRFGGLDSDSIQRFILATA